MKIRKFNEIKDNDDSLDKKELLLKIVNIIRNYPEETASNKIFDLFFNTNNHLPSLPKFASSNFDDVVKLAQRLTTGNVSHQGKTIEGLAKRTAEFIRKYY